MKTEDSSPNLTQYATGPRHESVHLRPWIGRVLENLTVVQGNYGRPQFIKPTGLCS
jgi:hypothetical protein